MVAFFFLPESPRWLVGKRKIDKARKVLQDVSFERGHVVMVTNNFDTHLLVYHNCTFFATRNNTSRIFVYLIARNFCVKKLCDFH